MSIPNILMLILHILMPILHILMPILHVLMLLHILSLVPILMPFHIVTPDAATSKTFIIMLDKK